ncbi:RNA polymerase II-associated protein 1-like [Haliotis rufescens]|uniref:RNA polymerase II-associated protein 1-like n=1 Tax=Haliotis rufescens TaxID=6454 RepID=UPI00201EF342|nr:RNA polymerase II-associated protein 1-like [Haliotis rufescens]
MLKRPKPGESEDDLLKFQQEFLARNESDPSASVKRADKRKPSGDEKIDVVKLDELPQTLPPGPAPVKKSKFRRAREEQLSKEAADRAKTDDAEERLEKDDRHMAQVLTQIIERDTRNAAVFLPRQTSQAFPSALHRGNTPQSAASVAASSGKKKSLFAQHLATSGVKDFGVVLQQELQKTGEMPHNPNTDVEERGDGDSTSRIVQGSGLSATLGTSEARKIHEENLDKISTMTQEEIDEERKKLMEMMDPKLLAFLTSKKKVKSEIKEMETETNLRENVASGKKISKKKGHSDPVLPVQPDPTWVHMEKVEYDKLEWMRDLPPPKTGDAKNGLPARFDFHGNILPADSDLPVNQGLHHHGNEPERAGYTLEEMFQLARSSNIQQRALALQVLGRVLHKAKRGAYRDVVQTPILPAVVESGVVFLFRWALDDAVDTVLAAAVAAMHALICNPADQECLDRSFSWFQGHVMPGQCPVTMETERQDGEETVDETDAEVAKRDVVLGLVSRMVLLQRLRHVLETRKPQAVTVLQVLDMLTKIAQHSPGLAYEIVHCPRLLDVVFLEFLPTAWEPQDSNAQLSRVYGLPLTAALRLVAALCQAGRNMAAHMISKYKLQDIIMRYMAVKTSDLQLPREEAEMLQTHSFRVWRICLSYGLATQTYLDLYSTLVGNIQSALSPGRPSQQQMEATMLACCETVVNVAGSVEASTGFVRSHDSSAMETERSEEVISPDVNWSHVAGLFQPITSCVQCVLEDIRDNYQFKKCDLHFGTSCVNFLATFYQQVQKQASYSPVECLQEVEEFCCKSLLPCWKSLGLKTILRDLSQHSNLLSPPESASQEVAPCLVELLASHPDEDFTVPVLRSDSPYGFLTALLRLLHILCQLHKGIIDKILVDVIQDEDLMGYMKKVSRNKPSCLVDNYFTRHENYLQYYFLKLAALKPGPGMSVLHRCSLHLLSRLPDGDEYLAFDLLSTTIFSPDFLPDGKEDGLACEDLEEMKLGETSQLKSATQREITASRGQLLREVYTRLPGIRATYLTAFSASQQAVTASKNRLAYNTAHTDCLMTSSSGGGVLPRDWMYLPLIQLYVKASAPGSWIQDSVPPHLVSMASDVLYWGYVLECWRPHILGVVSTTLKVTRVMCAFMAGNDLFLDRCVSSYLAALLQEYTKPAALDRLDFTENIPGLSSFYDLFSELLQQYESVSFGDSLFACFVLLPLQRRHGVQMRRLVWGEKAAVLRTFMVPLKQVVIPIERFLEPDESDLPLLHLYFQCLISQTVRPMWAPIMYLTAVHHVNRFLYYQADRHHQGTRDKLWRQLMACKQEEVKHHVLYYKMADVEQEYGMTFYTQLPAIRQNVVDGHTPDVQHRGRDATLTT